MKAIRLAGFVACLIAALIGEASAECAWVLWMLHGTLDASLPIAAAVVDGKPSDWQPLQGFTTAKACDSALDQAESREASVLFKRNENKPKGELWSAYAYRCLPDVVDPRGPKGK